MWDKFAADLSDSDDEPAPGQPRVTTLNERGAITIGPSGWNVNSSSTSTSSTPKQQEEQPSSNSGASISITNPNQTTNSRPSNTLDYSKWNTLADQQSDSDSDHITNEMMPNRPDPPRNEHASGPVVAPKGMASASLAPEKKMSTHTLNGGTTDRYLWSQEKDLVTVSVFVPIRTRGRQIKLQVQSLHILVKLQGVVLLEGKLSHEVLAGEDDVDWEVKPLDEQRSLVVITLTKKPIGPGVVLWWKSILVGDPEIDPTHIQDRAKNDYRQVWQEAHDLFREKVAELVPKEIDTNIGDSDED